MTAGLQPFLSDRVVALAAPTQAWSGRDGDMGAAPIDGIYHGDTRFVRGLDVHYAGADGAWHRPEHIATDLISACTVRMDALLRGVDDDTPDPKVRLQRERTVVEGRVTETLTVHSHRDIPVPLRLRARVRVDIGALQDVKAGASRRTEGEITIADGAVVVRRGDTSVQLTAPDAAVTADDGEITLEWRLDCPARGRMSVSWTALLADAALVVRGATTTIPWERPCVPAGADPRLQSWLDRALDDLGALRLALPAAPEDEFFAAGAPWFFTLFGRDSLWAARLLLPLDARIAASTLRVLARLQGTHDDPATAEQPGKIMHELRASTLTMPGEGIVLPPLYYGTVDATALWICLFAETAQRMPDADVIALLPAMEAALDWIVASAERTGFLEYVDETGHGLSNQGWKDSGDSIQWQDGSLAAGPIALCEVQGYAYEAAIGGADLLERFGRPGAERVRAWARDLKDRFAERFWVTTPSGRFPAIALDREGRAVDTLTSNIGHLLGTGILDRAQEASVSDLLIDQRMASGFGIRTLSTDAGGYWPLSYHGGSVWIHDTAIVARGMLRAGRHDHARRIVAQMLAGAEAFEFRVPELYAGDSADEVRAPAPSPAACRPQAWTAAAAVTAWEVLRAD